MDLWVRVSVAVLLFALLFGSFVHYEAAEDEHDPYPSTEEIATAYDAHIGDRALLFGTVKSTEPGRLTVNVESDEGDFEMTVHRAGVAVEPGGVVQVYGTLEPGYIIDPVTVEVVNTSGNSAGYKYGVSAVGALLVAGLFFRYWRLDTDEWAFEVRSDG